MFDEKIDAEEKAFDEFIKEYGQREEDWTIYDNDWHNFYPVLIELPYYLLELRSEI
ncbi:9863_t:CDS:2 [Funneliformis mosseae]|uniref:9863_t:CDS:1 n=1 Tax=Funneliformis mosseae TaxID=27381 RepID=A0A9N9GTH7_FUNMO|nr:9863_t:CDS:2 [Funneliformis mosseae]